MTILAGAAWRTNAELILAVASLGYIRLDDQVVDLTYGRGKWWRLVKPPHLLACRWTGEPEFGSELGPFDPLWQIAVDDWVTEIPDGMADVVAFDPPYVSKGGRTTSTIPDFNGRYGLDNAAPTPRGLHNDNLRGLKEAVRICRPGGFILVKCMNYISSGKFQPAAHWMRSAAVIYHDLEQCEEFHHVGHVRMQPPGRRQVHARNNVSTLYVFRKRNL